MEEKVRVDALAAYAKNENRSGTVINTSVGGYEFQIRPLLSLKDMMEFVETAVDMCFRDSDGSYMPEIRDFAIMRNLVKYYSNLDLPGDVSECYEALCVGADFLNAIVNTIDQRQYHMILEAISDKIDNIVQARVSSAAIEMNNLMGAFADVSKQLEGFLGSVDEKTVRDMAKALLDGKIDEKKLVEAVMQEKSEKKEA